MIKTKLLIAALLSGFFVTAVAQQAPEDMVSRPVQMLLHCVSSYTHPNPMSRMTEILGNQWGEAPVAMMELSKNSSAIMFTNRDFTTSSIVILRINKDNSESCLLWSGSSQSGLGWSLNANPVFPPKKAETGT